MVFYFNFQLKMAHLVGTEFKVKKIFFCKDFISLFKTNPLQTRFPWRHDIHRNYTQHDVTLKNGTQHDDNQRNDIQHNDTRHKNTKHKNTHPYDVQHNNTQLKDTQNNNI